MFKKKRSPYTQDPNRLADVLAAIQALAVYEFHMRSFESWATSINGDATMAKHWEKVFKEHPEFFRLDTSRTLASLVWRRQFPKRYHVDRQMLLSVSELEALSDEEKTRLTRSPLSPADIKTLIDAAINMHSRAMEYQKESRWWIGIAGTAGGFLGSVVGAIFS